MSSGDLDPLEQRVERAPAAAYPIGGTNLRRFFVSQDWCPECGGDLDTGWECNSCGYDAKPIADAVKLDAANA